MKVFKEIKVHIGIIINFIIILMMKNLILTAGGLIEANVSAQKTYIEQVAKEQISMMRAKYNDCSAN